MPICAPFNFTFAPGIISSPARSVITVTGTGLGEVAAELGDGGATMADHREDT